MNRKLVFALAFLLLVVAVALSGCVNKPEICNYDGVCQANETNSCVDCRDVLGRGVDILPQVQNESINATNGTAVPYGQ